MSEKTNIILSDNIAGVNQILPHVNKWAWDLFIKATANNWTPNEVPMLKDIEQWKSKTVLSENEKLVIKRCMGFFAGSESLVGNNLLLNIFKYVTDPECYSEDTEILTNSGWKLFSDLNEFDNVAQFNDNNTVEFVKPLNITKHYTKDSLINFSDGNNRMDILVTKNHKMVLQRKGEIKLLDAQNVNHNSYDYYLRSGKIIGGHKRHVTPFEKFLIAYQADGSRPSPAHTGSRSGYLQAYFNLVKDRKKDRLKAILDESKLEYSVVNLKNRPEGYQRFYVNVKPDLLTKKFDWINLSDVSENWCIEFIEELCQWDGSTYGDRLKYDTTEKFNADVVQSLATLAGYGCTISVLHDKRKESYKDVYSLTILKKKNTISGQCVNKTEVPYEGYVYCVEVPSNKIIVRRNNKVLVCGNCRQYILRQANEEALHNWTVVYICDSLGLDIQEVYEAYNNVPSIKAKDDFLMQITTDLSRNDFTTSTLEGKKEFLRNLITYYIVCEGTFFFSGFAMLLSFGRQNKMPGISEQIQYTLRDESLHIQFGVQLINTIKNQFPDVWTEKFQLETIEHIKKAVELEVDYAHDVLPQGILGLNANMFVDYMQYIANRRLEALDLNFRYENKANPFGWLSESIDLQKQKNFFESRVTDYQTGVLRDDF